MKELKSECQCLDRKEHFKKHGGTCIHKLDFNTRHLPSDYGTGLPVGKYWYYHCKWCNECLPEYAFSYKYQ